MQNKIAAGLVIFFLSSQLAFAEMLLFTREDCQHCENLLQEIESQELNKEFQIKIYQVDENEENQRLYVEKSVETDYRGGLVPLLIDERQYRDGKAEILEYLIGKSADKNPEIALKTKGQKSSNTSQNTTTLNKAESQELHQLLTQKENPKNSNWGILLLLISSIAIAARLASKRKG